VLFLIPTILALIPQTASPGTYLPASVLASKPRLAAIDLILLVLPSFAVFIGFKRRRRWGRTLMLAGAILTVVTPVSWYLIVVLTSQATKDLFGVLPRAKASGLKKFALVVAWIAATPLVIGTNLGTIQYAVNYRKTHHSGDIPAVEFTEGKGINPEVIDAGYCGAVVGVTGMITYVQAPVHTYTIQDASGAVHVSANPEFPMPAINDTARVLGVVKCGRGLDFLEVARFPGRLAPEATKVVRARVDIVNFMYKLSDYEIFVGRFPTSAQGLRALRQKARREGGPEWEDDAWSERNWPQAIPKDPWGHDYVYKYPGEHGHNPDIVCLGADGQPGGVGPNADIVSWDLHQ